jgi:uncharacterized protein (DUF1501 family)
MDACPSRQHHAPVRAALKGVLAQHPEVSARAREPEVFPDSSGARPLKGLVGGA